MSPLGDKATAARRPHDAEASRRALLDAAREVFDEVGYDRATTREIGDRAGVDPALIARYFDSKEGLFIAAIAAGAPGDEEIDFAPAELLRFLLERWDERGHNPISRALASPALTDGARERISAVVGDRVLTGLALKGASVDGALGTTGGVSVSIPADGNTFSVALSSSTPAIAAVPSAVAFLKAAVGHYAKLGVAVERVMTDNGSYYRSRAFARICKRLGLKHIRTRPYTPKTNGKAERFIQTAPRMGLHQSLSPLRPTRRRATALAPSLQLASTSC